MRSRKCERFALYQVEFLTQKRPPDSQTSRTVGAGRPAPTVVSCLQDTTGLLRVGRHLLTRVSIPRGTSDDPGHRGPSCARVRSSSDVERSLRVGEMAHHGQYQVRWAVARIARRTPQALNADPRAHQHGARRRENRKRALDGSGRGADGPGASNTFGGPIHNREAACSPGSRWRAIDIIHRNSQLLRGAEQPATSVAAHGVGYRAPPVTAPGRRA